MAKQSGDHSVSDYNELVDALLEKMPHENVMHAAVGGEFAALGVLQRNIVLRNGLGENGYLIDIGCGSGRTAYALRTLAELKYLGTDVVEAFLTHAAAVCERPDWRYLKTTELKVPERDGVADMVCAFSLFTHLLHEETYAYLAEAFRVLKPGGYMVFSFLEFGVAAHWAVFQTNIERIGMPGHLNQFMDPVGIRVWADHLGFDVVAIHRGDTDYVELDEDVAFEDGRVFSGAGSLGQSLAILRKPEAPPR